MGLFEPGCWVVGLLGLFFFFCFHFPLLVTNQQMSFFKILSSLYVICFQQHKIMLGTERLRHLACIFFMRLCFCFAPSRAFNTSNYH